MDHFEEDEPSGSSTQGGRTINEDGNEQHEPYNEVQEDNRDDEEDMSDQGTEGHVIKPPNIHQPLDQGNGNSCKAPCCTASIINQPRDKCLLNKIKTMQSGKPRCFLSSWSIQFKWIHFCRQDLKFFVTTVSTEASSLSGRNIKADQAYVTTGFSNWKKTIERFKDHEHSVTHN